MHQQGRDHTAIGGFLTNRRIRFLEVVFNLHVAAGQNKLDREIRSGYCGDLLSDVMANAPDACIWLTVQTHQNIVPVAVLHEMAAVILAGGQEPDQETIKKADEEGIPILMWPKSTFDFAGQVCSAGVIKAGS